MKLLKKHIDTVKLLSHGKPSICKGIIKYADTDLIKCLCEICHNVLKGNVPLTSIQKRKLQRYKQTIRGLSSYRKTSQLKKKQLLQKGGFLGALLPPIIGLLGSLFTT